MKYLIACLGNIGAEYANTRHNIGFMVADRLAKDLGGTFTTSRLAMVAELKFKGRQLVVIKPTTYMNLSGKAVKYWMTQEKVPMENVLVVCDDLALPVGTLRLKKKAATAATTGLKTSSGRWAATSSAGCASASATTSQKGSRSTSSSASGDRARSTRYSRVSMLPPR